MWQSSVELEEGEADLSKRRVVESLSEEKRRKAFLWELV